MAHKLADAIVTSRKRPTCKQTQNPSKNPQIQLKLVSPSEPSGIWVGITLALLTSDKCPDSSEKAGKLNELTNQTFADLKSRLSLFKICVALIRDYCNLVFRLATKSHIWGRGRPLQHSPSPNHNKHRKIPQPYALWSDGSQTAFQFFTWLTLV